MNALFIHGFNGSSNSRTGAGVRKTLKDKCNVIIPDFNIIMIEETLSKIDEIVKNENIQLLVGTSLGAFYVLYYKTTLPKIIINPCMKPSLVVSKLDKALPEKIVEEVKNCEAKLYTKDATQNERVMGLFADNDELLGQMFKPLFEEFYGKENIIDFESGHHAGDKVHDALLEAVAKLGLK